MTGKMAFYIVIMNYKIKFDWQLGYFQGHFAQKRFANDNKVLDDLVIYY